MKNFYTILLFCLNILAGFSQQAITLTFVGEDAPTHHYLALDSVYVNNLTVGCDTTIYGASPTLTFLLSLGINEPPLPSQTSFTLVSIIPNPFYGITMVSIYVPEREPLTLFLSDISGKRNVEFKGEFKRGLHQFEISCATVKFLILHVSDGKITKSLKLVNISTRVAADGIRYIGLYEQKLTGDQKSQEMFRFVYHPGDQLSYTAYTGGYTNKTIIDSPTQDTSYTLVMTASGFPVFPTVTTDSVSDIAQNTAVSGGNVISDGGATVTARGVCWSTSQNPTLSDPHTSDGTGAGNYTSYITGLNPNTPYFVRAYAINSFGTSYGDQKSFTTSGGASGQPCPGLPTFTDTRDGQVYPTVQIGTQCWLQKNMNYQNGNSWCYDSSASNCDEYGRLYDWQSALGACPSGWHLPVDDEWTTLTTFLTGGTGVGTKMKSTSGWYQNGNGDNSSGFTGLPGGRRLDDGSFIYITKTADFWSSEYSSTQAWARVLYNDYNGLDRIVMNKTYGFSVRCLKD